MTNGSHDSATAVPDAVTVGIFAPADAEGIVQLFRAVYGEGYPIRLFYDSQAIIAANETGEYCGVVARTPSGEVVGVEHLFPSTPYPALLEAGVGLVRKDFRGAGINRRLLGFLYEEYAPQHPEIEEVYGEAVCYHTHMQRAVLEHRHVETAVQVALMPAETYALEKESSTRVATLDLFRCYRPKPHTVFLPHAYEEVLRWTYGRLDDARALEPSREQVPKDARTAAEMTVFDYAGVARIAVGAAGEDLAARLADLERQALDAGAVVVQVRLNLVEPWVDHAVDVLRDRGYFFGGALPRWFGGDGFLMQKLFCPPDFDGIVLASDAGRRLLETAVADWEERHAL